MPQVNRGYKTYDSSSLKSLQRSLGQVGKLWLPGILGRLQWEGHSPFSIAGGFDKSLLHDINIQSPDIVIDTQLSQLRESLLFPCHSWGDGGEWSTVRSGLTDGLCLVDHLAPGQVGISLLSHTYLQYWCSNHSNMLYLGSRSFSFRCTASGCSQQG